MGEDRMDALRVGFKRNFKLEFRGTKVTSECKSGKVFEICDIPDVRSGNTEGFIL